MRNLIQEHLSDPAYTKFVATDENDEFIPKCVKCDQEFDNFEDLHLHIQVNYLRKPEQKFPCEVCKLSYRSKTALMNHEATVHNVIAPDGDGEDEADVDVDKEEQDYNPPELGAYVHDQINSFAAIQRSWICKDCKKSFPAFSNFIQHVKGSHLRAKDVICEHCGKALVSEKHLNRHMEDLHYDIYYSQIEKLKDKFSGDPSKASNKEIREKCLEELKSGQFRCRECKKFLSRLDGAMDHVKNKHLKIKRVKCDRCDFMGYSAADIRTHAARMHDNTKAKRFCDLTVEEAIAECMYKEGDGHPLTTCKRCAENGHFDVDFVNIDRLRNHIGHIHLNKRPKQCPHCNKSYMVQKRLDWHIARVHTKDPEQLKMDQFLKENLAKTKKVPGVSGGLECPICQKVYRGNMRQHLLQIHLNIRDIVCEICNKDYSGRTALKFHMKSAHNVELATTKRVSKPYKKRRKQLGKTVQDIIQNGE